MQSPSKVYAILKKYKTDYIILEDSICLTFKENNCGLVQLLDINNKHINPYNNDIQVKPKAKRFCDEIRHNSSSFTKYFKLVMKNPTFRVYNLL